MKKEHQTFYWREDLLKALKESNDINNFNKFCEDLMCTHPKLRKYKLWKLK